MTVNNINSLGGGNTLRNDAGKPSAARSGQGEQSPVVAEAGKQAGDALSLSARAERMQAIESRLAQTPEVDQERVAAIKQAIAEGNYPVNAERMADNMLQLESLLSR